MSGHINQLDNTLSSERPIRRSKRSFGQAINYADQMERSDDEIETNHKVNHSESK